MARGEGKQPPANAAHQGVGRRAPPRRTCPTWVSSINGTKIVLEKFTNENQIKNCSDTVTQRLYSPESLQFVGLICKQMFTLLCCIDQIVTKPAK